MKKQTRTRRGLGGTPDYHTKHARAAVNGVTHAVTCRIGWEQLGRARAHYMEAGLGARDLTPLLTRARKRMEELCAGQLENKRLGSR
jgi:hypothetical protein